MRIRTIKPEFWRHPILGKLPDNTRLLALALLNYADDDGFFLADPALVRGECMPFEKDYRRITVSLRELSSAGWIKLSSETEMGVIGVVVNFGRHQVVNKPRKSTLSQYFNSGSPTGELPEASLPEWNGKDKEGNRNGKDKGREAAACRILAKVNDLSGKQFREVDGNLKIITARLAERDVDEDGMGIMLDRMAQWWLNDDKMREYFRPSTLFGKEKFDGYYASRLAPIPNQNGHRPLSQMEINACANVKSEDL